MRFVAGVVTAEAERTNATTEKPNPFRTGAWVLRSDDAKPSIIFMQAISMSPRRPFQFGLRELLIWFTLAAIALSIFTAWNQAIGLWLVAYALAFRCLRAHVRKSLPVTSRRIATRKQFWRVVAFILPLAACLNLVTFCQTYRTTWVGTDGDCYCIGWPVLFRIDGYGFAGRYLYYDLIGLQVDLAVCAGITAATGLALKDGGRRLAATTARFFRGRSLTPRPRHDREVAS
jgi:hypothetical protein